MREFIPGQFVHISCHYHGQWIPGDERGFRSRGHKIHSSGDYRDPPPVEEHAGLRHYVRKHMECAPVALSREQFEAVGVAFVRKLQRMSCEVFAVCASRTHLHALFRATDADIVKQVGKAKQFASLKCPDFQGNLWGEGCAINVVDHEDHLHAAFLYVCDHARKESAYVWRCDDESRLDANER